MQIVVTAVQNAVDRRDMGAATSSVTFFRSMGAAFGTALFGAILTSRLGHYLAAAGGGILPTGAEEAEIANNVKAIQALPAEVKAVVIDVGTVPARRLHHRRTARGRGPGGRFFIPEVPLRGASDVEPILATE